jgi:hypothetical protein
MSVPPLVPYTMSDLICVRCDKVCSYADAAIADNYETCHGLWEHEWLERINRDIDVVSTKDVSTPERDIDVIRTEE